MKKLALSAALVSGMGLAACDPITGGLTPDAQVAVGAVGGALTGVALANLVDANDNWTLAAGLAGAAAGTLVARNAQNNQCAYSNGDGTYTVVPCP